MIPVLKVISEQEAIFLRRPNRFLAVVRLANGQEVEAHVHDPGRLPQLLYPGARVVLKRANNPRRRTRWSLLAAKHANQWVFINSGYHRALTEKILRKPNLFPLAPLKEIIAEPQVENGRLDYLLLTEKGEKIFVEVKGCTMAQGKMALFPDAPTTRGSRHLKTLLSLKRQGFGALLWVLVFRPETKYFAPAADIDPCFARIFEEALEGGVQLITMWFSYDRQWLKIRP